MALAIKAGPYLWSESIAPLPAVCDHVHGAWQNKKQTHFTLVENWQIIDIRSLEMLIKNKKEICHLPIKAERPFHLDFPDCPFKSMLSNLYVAGVSCGFFLLLMAVYMSHK